MKEHHGEVLDEFERVVRELDTLSNELHMVSDHAVQLDANFSKYGYSAHLSMYILLELPPSLWKRRSNTTYLHNHPHEN
jgi:hypothetical protein